MLCGGVIWGIRFEHVKKWLRYTTQGRLDYARIKMYLQLSHRKGFIWDEYRIVILFIISNNLFCKLYELSR